MPPPALSLILGQTATGKTAYATDLARRIGGELVNCDSRQIYRGLDIITGKTDNPIDIPVHLTDIVDPHERYSSLQYAVDTHKVVRDIIARSRVPIIVGGSGPYAHMFLQGDPSHTPPQDEKDQHEQDLNKCNVRELQDMLRKIDQSALDRLNSSDRANPRRLANAIRRLTAIGGQGSSISGSVPTYLADSAVQVSIFLHADNERMMQRIISRVDARLRAGAVEECVRLMSAGYTWDNPGLQTIGYRSIQRMFTESASRDKVREEWITKERQYAKRQRTYLLKYFPQAQLTLV